jgi:hypothetical protein
MYGAVASCTALAAFCSRSASEGAGDAADAMGGRDQEAGRGVGRGSKVLAGTTGAAQSRMEAIKGLDAPLLADLVKHAQKAGLRGPDGRDWKAHVAVSAP